MVQLTACSRVRPAAAGLLNGTLPGSAAAAAAVNLYTGAAGARVHAGLWGRVCVRDDEACGCVRVACEERWGQGCIGGPDAEGVC